MLALVGELKEQGMTIVMATHEMSFARQAADRVVFLDAGVVLEQGPPEQVLVEPGRAADPAVPGPDPGRRPPLSCPRGGAGDRRTERRSAPA